MIVIIDGYNVLKQHSPGKFISDNERSQFIQRLASYKKKRGHTIVIIFDGGDCSWPTWGEKKGIQVVYSGSGVTADDVIREYIAEHMNKDLLLVSSDRQLCLWASQHGVPALDSLAFFSIMHDTIRGKNGRVRRKETLVKMTQSDNEELDALMRESSKVVPDKDVRREPLVRGHAKRSHTLSKVERLLRKKIEKL